ncbi:cell division protein CrgA [Arachnia propionica]|uniref:Cell division protein CrgA n=1 Tax=Arachnia propionica TaxID=1750 RepID=A0A3S4YZV3_9ACTN|nr:cell division protein CrgA [Arachnia propionica]QUC13750.1 cell division protein CrgA [Arachnia propionica]VEH71313.1 putative septation inhibitor protein [Arachnia propionica]VEJ59707.1 putative septation inhibitor protein [Arachnia propionica]
MPESKVRKEAKSKARKKQSEELEKARKERRDRKRLAANTERRWVPWVFIPVGLLGVLWMVTWNLAGNYIGFMRALTEWNILIALGLIIACFSLMTLWK